MENLIVLAAFNANNQGNSYVEFQWMTVLGHPVDFICENHSLKGRSGQVTDLLSWHSMVEKAEVIQAVPNDDPPLWAINPDHQAILKAQDEQRAHDRANAHLSDYFKMEQDIHKLFGYEEGYRTFPLVDCRNYFWSVTSYEVSFADTREEMEDEPTYQCELHCSRHLPQTVWRNPHHTLILFNTGADFNIHLGVFDNTKEVK